MNPTRSTQRLRKLVLAQACALFAVSLASAQQTKQDPVRAAQDAQALAKYDKNKNGRLDADEQAAMAADNNAAASAASASSSGAEVFLLSPFQVDASKDTGYFAENTLVGSRLRTNVSDLAASITVVTKQQLQDTGSVDINDVFMYEANTEGAHSYTPTNLSRGLMRDSIAGWSDDLQGAPQTIATANRVRGLGSADTAQNNYPTIQRVPFDTYNTNSVEISRGPNSMLFGTGGASGIVNQSTAEAQIGKAHTTVDLRGGSFDAYRASFNTNVPIGDKLAVFAAALYDRKGFERKPSDDIYRRQYAALTFKPTKKTKLTASFEHYDNYNNRPNFAMPIDFVSEWRNSGRPSWDPSTQMITYSDGATKGPYLIDSRDARARNADGTLNTNVNFPIGNAVMETTTATGFYVAGLTLQSPANRPHLRFDNGKVVDFWVDSALAGATTTTLPNSVYAAPTVNAVAFDPVTGRYFGRTPAQWIAASARSASTRARVAPVPAASTGATGYGSWAEVAVTDKGIYDWTKYNIQGSNYGTQDAETYNIEFQQELLPNLNLSVGWFRQELKEYTHYGQGQANDAVRLFVDVNTKLLDGTPNPYYGAAYLQDWQADDFSRPETNNNLRAMLAYELDFRQRDGWLSNLGHHRFLALGSQQKQENNNLRYRLSYDGGDPRFLPTPANLAAAGNNRNSWAGNAASIARWYYVGSPAGAGTVDHGIKAVNAPGLGGPDHATLRFYDWTTGAYSTSEMDFDHNLFYAGGGFGVTQKKTDSSSFGWTGYLWKDRIIPTLGWRKDKVKISQNNRTGITADKLYTNGFGIPGADEVQGPSIYFAGTTRTLGGAVRPFQSWPGIDQKADGGNFLADAVRNLSFYYNKSDNFNAPSTLQTNFFRQQNPVPTGEGKDYGVGLSLFKNKLVIRLNWYEETNQDAPSAAGSTPAGRVVRIDTQSARDWATAVVRIRSGENPSVAGWGNSGNNTTTPLTSAQQDQIATLYGLPFDWPQGANIQPTESNVSKGKELQLTYNPTRSWTMKLTVGQQKASYSKSVKEISDWLAVRMPVWTSLKALDLAPEYIKADGSVLRLQNYWTGTGFSSDAASNSAGPVTTGTGTPEQTFGSIVTPEYYRLRGLENTNSPNLREWSASYLTNYTFTQERLKGFAVGGSVRWASNAVAGYYGLIDPSTYSHPTPTTANITYPDLARPIYTPAETNVDLFVSYTRKLTDKVRMKVQLNVRDVTESGKLIATQFNPDGSAAGYRIIDPRTWFVTTSFDF